MPSRVSAFGFLLLALLMASPVAHAFTVSISPGSRMLYLRVGDGAFGGGPYTSGGTPQDSATINLVQATVAAGALGNGSSQVMASNATQLTSDYDGYAFCNAGEVYIGGFLRQHQGGTATLSVTSPMSLTSTSGDAIAMSKISWTSSGNGDTGGQPIPGGTFNGSTQTLASFPRNQWQESCHPFRYANDAVVPAGTYAARVTYTLAAP